MKKIILAGLCLCLFFTGCAVPGPTGEAATLSTVPVVLQTHAADGTLLLTRSSPHFTLEHPDHQLAKAMETDLQSRISKWMAPSADLPDYATESYNAEKPWTAWFVKLESRTMRLDTQVLSLYFEYSEFTGGNHPNLATYSVTYDCKTGKALEIEDTLRDGISVKTLSSAVNKALSAQSDHLYDDYEALVGKAFADEAINWYLSQEGLCFHFAPYAIGPYSSGVVTATLPYSQLSDIMKEAYIP